MTKKKIFFFTPIFNYMDADIIKNHYQIRKMSNYEVVFVTIKGASVEHSKSIAYRKFLESDCTHFFNVDADIFFFFEGVSPIDLLIEQDKDIVSGIYVYKREPCLPTHRPIDLQDIYEREGKFPENYKFVIPNELHEIMFSAGGCMMIKREVIEKLINKYQVPNLPMIHKGEYLSEDFAFSPRCRREGYKIWAFPTIKLGHLGQFLYKFSDYQDIDK